MKPLMTCISAVLFPLAVSAATVTEIPSQDGYLSVQAMLGDIPDTELPGHRFEISGGVDGPILVNMYGDGLYFQCTISAESPYYSRALGVMVTAAGTTGIQATRRVEGEWDYTQRPCLSFRVIHDNDYGITSYSSYAVTAYDRGASFTLAAAASSGADITVEDDLLTVVDVDGNVFSCTHPPTFGPLTRVDVSADEAGDCVSFHSLVSETFNPAH